MKSFYRVVYAPGVGFFIETHEFVDVQHAFDCTGFEYDDSEEGAVIRWRKSLYDKANELRKTADSLDIIAATRTPKLIQDPILIPDFDE